MRLFNLNHLHTPKKKIWNNSFSDRSTFYYHQSLHSKDARVKNVDRSLIQVYKMTIFHYLSPVIGIRVQGIDLHLRH